MDNKLKKGYRVGLVQSRPRLGRVQDNLESILEATRRGARMGCHLLVFPELALTGYFLKDLVPDVARSRKSPEVRALARASRGISFLVGLVEEAQDHRFYNAAFYFEGGKLRGVHRKIYLPTYGLFDEARDIAPGDRITCLPSRFGRLGVMICEDAWHPSVPYLLSLDGAEFMVILSSSPARGFPRGGKRALTTRFWGQIGAATAALTTTPLVYCNRVGTEEGMAFGGGSFGMDARGRSLLGLASRRTGIIPVQVRPSETRAARVAVPLLRDERPRLVLMELQRILDQRGRGISGPILE